MMQSTDPKPASKLTSDDNRAPASAEVVAVRAPIDIATAEVATAAVMTRQRLPYFLGISAATAGAKGLAMHLVSIPPGASSEPHIHRGYETAIYVLQGRVETRYGAGLARSVISEPGDFLFIPPDVPHQSVNLSTTEHAHAVIARNDAREHEHVVLYDPDAEPPGS